MVPICLRNDRRPLSRALLLPSLHRHNLRYAAHIHPTRAGHLHHAGPRFAMVALWYCMTARRGGSLAKFVAGVGIFRTLTCGGWTYVTSTDDHNWHDIFMISYLVATIPWTVGCLALSPPHPKAVQYRKYFATAFFGTLVPLVYFFIQHKVHKVAGGRHTRSRNPQFLINNS